jgi:hypothetical protein
MCFGIGYFWIENDYWSFSTVLGMEFEVLQWEGEVFEGGMFLHGV